MIEELKSVLEEIKNGNCFGEKVYLVGATKMQSIETINEAIFNGLQIVAENKVQEFREKHAKLFFCEEHFIGHLQTNKVKYLINNVSLIQSVDSIELAKVINAESLKKNTITNILLEVNSNNEESKSGFSFDEIYSAFNSIKEYKNIKIMGLMAMLPKTDDENLLRNLCLQMRKIYDTISKDYKLTYLSMGMSHDYKLAISCGSNMIRLGTRIFGERNYGEKI